MTDPEPTPWQRDRNEVERSGTLPPGWLHTFHRHFASDAVHRDGGPECGQPGTPRRVYVFDPDVLDEHELLVARYAAACPEEFFPADEQSSLIRNILEALCRRDGLSLESTIVPGEPARNYELADRLGIGRVFGLPDGSGA
jgi:hypothetical protein